MKIETKFKNEKRIPVKYTADGENVNPEIIISGIPDSAQSLVLIIEDPDAERVAGHTFYHWAVSDIPVHGSTLTIKENSLPGNPSESSTKRKEYMGPSPPRGGGEHHYHFRVYALSKKIMIPSMSPIDKVIKEIEKNQIDSTEIVGIYSR